MRDQDTLNTKINGLNFKALEFHDSALAYTPIDVHAAQLCLSVSSCVNVIYIHIYVSVYIHVCMLMRSRQGLGPGFDAGDSSACWSYAACGMGIADCALASVAFSIYKL